MKKILLALLLLPHAAFANWETAPGYSDDGSRVVLSLAGGFSYASAKIKNELGTVVPDPYYEDAAGNIVTESYCEINGGCDSGYTYLGQVDIAKLAAAKRFSSVGFTGNISVGYIFPNAAHWRFMGSWDIIAETEFDALPLFSGNLTTDTGNELHVLSSGVHTAQSTDIASVMAIYDFYDGDVKSAGAFVPYIGFGIGYANTNITMNLVDIYGDLSTQDAFYNLGQDNGGAIDFYESKHSSSNVAGLATIGFAYGIADNIFLDFGLRLAYVPKINYQLNNAAADADTGVTARTIFSTDNTMYVNGLAGVRFEF